ncbi:MAG: hypothetical protein LBN42_03650, partial [Oscillospiraceae bacterium]|nr:hypothetical protein [Oscillospiraceae bacterium]
RHSFLLIFIAINLLIYFKNTNPKPSRFVNLIASASFGIYLIHTHPITLTFVFRQILNLPGYYNNGNMFYLQNIVYVIDLFAVCVVIDLIRQYALELPLTKLFTKLFGKIHKNSYTGKKCT